MNKRIYFLVFLLGVSFINPIFAENRALLIGIEKYPNLPRSLQLHGPANDVINMVETVLPTLNYQKAQIKTLIDTDATRENILATFNHWLIEGTDSGDKVFFYYSGHGGRIKDQAPFDEGEEGNDGFDEALAPSDTVPNGDSFSGMILDDELRVLFDRLEKKNVEVLVIIDSCFSGSITRGINLPKKQKTIVKTISKPLLRMINTRGLTRPVTEAVLIDSTPLRMVWTAASPLQLAFINPLGTNSIFTSLFVNAIKEKGGKISNTELFHDISKGSQQFCDVTEKCRSKQKKLTPTLEISKEKQLSAFVQSGFTPPPIDTAFSVLDYTGVSVEIREGNNITLGKNMRIDIKNTSSSSGQLIVLDHRADNTLIQLYPNKYKRDNFIKERGKFWVPKSRNDGFSIKASVRGDSEIIAIVIHDKVNLDELYKQTKDLEIVPVDSPNNYLEELLQTLQATWVDDVINRRVNYSAGRYSYTVK